MRAPLLLLLAISALALVLASCDETEEDLPDDPEPTAGAESPTPFVEESPAASPEPSPAPEETPALTPAPALDVPADWKEYQDPELGISLRYPPDLEFEDWTGPSPLRETRVYAFISPEYRNRGIMLAMYEGGGVSLEEWVSESGYGCAREEQREVSATTERAILCHGTTLTGNPTSELFFSRDSFIIRIQTTLQEHDTEFSYLVGSVRTGNAE